jgi:hypothetical protein
MAPPIPQDLSYHDFADSRRFLGIPNALDVLSNLPFVAVGIAGLAFLFRDRSSGSRAAFVTPAERQPYWMLFAGVTLTGFGSSYYHWNPGNTTLFWDRLPMTIAFMALLSSVIAERIDLKVGIRLLWPLVALGALSVLYWDFGERRGAGDLRPYALVQFGTLLAIPLIVWLFPPRYTATADLFIALGWYGLAKVLEYFDRPVLAAVGVSGHTLKHIASALGAWWLLRMVERRRPVTR